MEDKVTKFCVSHVTIMVMSNAIMDFISAWNSHRIPGRAGGIPNVLARTTNRLTALNPNLVPSTEAAVQHHEQNRSGRLSRMSTFGCDPLQGHTELAALRHRDFVTQFPQMECIFQEVLHGNSQNFKNAIFCFITLTNTFTSLLQ